MSETQTYTADVQAQHHSEVEITGEITADVLERHRRAVLAKKNRETTVPGFRPGHIPEKILLERIGEDTVLSEAAEQALKEVYPHIVSEKHIEAIGAPKIVVTKLAVGNPLGFRITVAVMPEVTLPDYKAIAAEEMAKQEEVTVAEDELDQAIKEIRKVRGMAIKRQLDPSFQGEIAEQDLPELTDEFVKTLGEFKNVVDFREKIRENMLKEKEMQARDKKRVQISDNVIESATIDLPHILIDHELAMMLSQLKSDLSRMNMEFSAYLEKINKTEEDLRKDWNEPAQKRAKLQLILNKIAHEESITADQTLVEQGVANLLAQHSDADPTRARTYIETVFQNEAVFQFLEKQGAPKIQTS